MKRIIHFLTMAAAGSAVLAGCGGAVEAPAGGASAASSVTSQAAPAPSAPSRVAVSGQLDSDAVQRVLSSAPSGRVVSIDATGDSLTLSMRVDSPSEVALAIWEASVIGIDVAKASRLGPTLISVLVQDASGKQVSQSADTYDPSPSPLSPETTDAVDATAVRAAVADAGATLVDLETWPTDGGATELTVTSSNPVSLVSDDIVQSIRLAFLAPDDQTPSHLVRVVDDAGTTIAAWGYIPKLGGGTNWGSAWYRSDLDPREVPGRATSALSQ